MGIRILREEAEAFRRAAGGVTVFEPRHRTRGDVFAGKYLDVPGGRAIDLSGLDYLALGSDPQVKRVMAESLERHDCGIPGSEAIIQTGQSHLLEQELARFHLGCGTAITFSSGYSTNFSLMEALGLRTNSHFIRMHRDAFPVPATEPAPTIFFMDGDLHFSARHGIRFASRLNEGACVAHTYRTGDIGHLAALLRRSMDSHGDRAVRVILTDTLESATGREFDMAELCRLAEEWDCLVYADEAHAVGVLGPRGRGVTAKVADFERYRDRLVIMGTLTKVFCQPGGYAAVGDPGLATLLKFCSPQHVFSAPVPPWIAAATVRLIGMVAGEYGETRRERLRAVARHARLRLAETGFDLVGDVTADTPIVAIPLRVPRLGGRVLEFLRREGFVVSVFQKPLMPAGREVLRLAVRADLEMEEVEGLVQALVRCREALPFTGSG
ncbi:8-amino-7-oxononanoate synthase [Streptosporangium becharense]|uniref:8-amino-7-oxononanoate synthase n=1 Tax=Streptosporangium becharense TaxID=1816182 RepID=A0A7W9IBI5_9ACTN|nr:aminotransferase class I/II-fold pyridoxal phosphate-dependent enzyme [Streptosporangium becharense]MBB2913588.1 8-amino-7-oxononanoate synthase [Streptosporangium becharense]MBB5817669.1 8-amino-7-oxononanoate synthase [Streptosporangium becharense]